MTLLCLQLAGHDPAFVSRGTSDPSMPKPYHQLTPPVQYAPPSYPGDVTLSPQSSPADDVTPSSLKRPANPLKSFKLPGPPTEGAPCVISNRAVAV